MLQRMTSRQFLVSLTSSSWRVTNEKKITSGRFPSVKTCGPIRESNGHGGFDQDSLINGGVNIIEGMERRCVMNL